MHNKFYTYCNVIGNNILVRGYDGDKQFTEKIPFSPTLYIQSKNPKSEWRSLYDNKPLEPIKFDTIKEARDFREQYKDVEGFKIHGQEKWQYQYIHDNFPGDIVYDLRLVKILTLDIECISDNGSFPDIQSANAPITLISLHNSTVNKTIVLGLKPYTKQEDDNFEYIQFNDEYSMLKYFIAYNQLHKFDVWTGWNIDQFDTPYIVNRIMRLFDDDMVKKLSPFNYIREKTIEIRGREVQTFDIFGIVSLDYLELYKKFTYGSKESYALGYIAQEELGETKVELPGESFKDAYNNHFQTFVAYNAKDTLLVKKLEEKMKLIELAFSLAFLYKCNIPDIYKTVLPWEIFIYNHLSQKKIAVPPHRKILSASFDGAWVKDVKPGMYGWMMSFDFAGLYPRIIMQWNMSPETFIDDYQPLTPDKFLQNDNSVIQCCEYAKANDYTIAANGSMYRKNVKGFLAELMEYVVEGRGLAKQEMLKLESEYQQTKDSSLQPRIAALHNRQMALKIAANAAYGAIGNEGFLYYEYRMAEAITTTGQLSDKHVAIKLNDKLNEILHTSTDYIALADTDSVYLDCNELVHKMISLRTVSNDTDSIVKFLDKFGEQICQPVINDSIDYIFKLTNGYKKVMNSKREAIASKTLIRAKKNYAMYVHNSEGVSYPTPKLKIMGIEIVRSSTPSWCRTKLKECVKYIFEKDEKFLRSYFENIYDEFCNLPAEDIASPRGVSDLDKWMDGKSYKKACPLHVRGSILYNCYAEKYNYDSIQNGDKIKFLYLKLPNPINENVIAFPSAGKLPKELNLHHYIDYELQFETTFKKPLTSLTDAAGWHLDDFSSLEEFFG
jgi:DNA polymerase elongation subunit (family B)